MSCTEIEQQGINIFFSTVDLFVYSHSATFRTQLTAELCIRGYMRGNVSIHGVERSQSCIRTCGTRSLSLAAAASSEQLAGQDG